MSVRTLHRLGWIGILVACGAILYVTLAPEPPHWGTVFPGGEATPVADAPVADAPSAPRPLPPPGWSEADEEAAGHFLVFLALGVAAALTYATSRRARRSPQRTMVVVLLLLWLFAGLTESMQAFLPTRSPSLDDLAYDVLGALVGFFGGSLVWRLLLSRLGIGQAPAGASTEVARPRRAPRD